MQEQIKEIIKRFKESDWNSQFEDKQNTHRFYINTKDAMLSKQQYQGWRVQERMARQKFESLVADGNRMHFCYEEILLQYSAHIEQLKEELSHRKRMHEEERLDSQKVIKELNQQIADLNKQIAIKQENYREIAEKYEELIQHANQVHLQESKHVKQLESQRMRQSMHYELEMKMSHKEIDETRNLLTEAMENNEMLLHQNNELKHKIERLIQANEYLKEKMNPQTSRQHIRVDNKQEQDLQSFGSIERGDFESLDKGSKFGLEEIKMNNSQQINFTDEKQLLNISEHYSKFNITQQLHRRGFSNDLDFNDNKSIVKKYMNNEMIEKINDLFEKDTIKNGSLIDEEIQCNLQNSHTICKTHAIDPYRAFFRLLVQCQKLNSPYFSIIAHIDLSSLFDELIHRFISYNLWQDEIRKRLHAKVHKK